ncbi:hypothetical protein HPB52_004550 [Rhipicephalus sanguineus]|uniref:Uncharacterized protein n=1 Tax=Rhipicephalus sanguineus TaxID=34632 RepID=A0A9D4SXJ6_RHISA|nr:hypothetical protein HPB52_004550 [Rhipicephalus sanguineus]
MPGDSRLKPSTQRAFGSRKKRAWNKKAPATSAPSAAELESRPDPLDLPGTSTDDTVGPSSTSETLRVDAAYYSTAEQAQRVERSAQTKTVLSGKSATQRKFDLLGQLHASVRTANLETSLRLLAQGALPSHLHPTGRKNVAKRDAGYLDLEARLIESQYEVTDRLAHHLSGRNPEHHLGQHFILPEMADW